MSAGERVAAQYRPLSTDQLRQHRSLIRNERRKAAIDLVLKERENTHQLGRDAAHISLNVLNGATANLADWIRRAEVTMTQKQEISDWIMYEFAHGYREALEEYQRDRADI